METTQQQTPQARDEGLVVHELADEVLVYDLERHRSHCLNHTAALIWRRCDGRTTVNEMAAQLQQELGVPGAEETIWIALQRLGRAHLLRERLPASAGPARSSRRALIRTLAMAGGLAMVTSIVAPEAYAAASNGVSCTLNTDCISNHCCHCVDGTAFCESDCGEACNAVCTGHGGRFGCN
jgi:hypothetical protein